MGHDNYHSRNVWADKNQESTMKYHEAVYDPKHAKSIVDPAKLTEWVFREGHKYWDAPVPLLDTHGKIVIPAASRTRAGPTITQAWNGDILVNGKTKIEIIRDQAMSDKDLVMAINLDEIGVQFANIVKAWTNTFRAATK